MSNTRRGATPAQRGKKTFSSIRKGPSDYENQVNHLTLEFMNVWRHADKKDAHDGKDPGGDDGSCTPGKSSPFAPAVAKPQGASAKPSASAAHRLRVLTFLKATTEREAQVMDLRGANLHADDFVFVGVVLANHPTISTVDLRGTDVTSLVAQLLTRVVSANRFVTDIFLDEVYLSMPEVQRLFQTLADNRTYVKEERKRRWINKESILYKESVEAFANLMEFFFVSEMRTRYSTEEVEWDRRNELVTQAHAHRKLTLRRQRLRRTMEMVLERLEIVAEREVDFRRAIRLDRIKNIVRLALDLEASARAAQCGEELRVRTAIKAEETKDWVLARRREKQRKEMEAAQRLDVEVAETAARHKRVHEASVAFGAVVQLAERNRDQTLIAESIRLEKERRDAIQKRKEAEAARERKEREDKESASQLLRLKVEQRKERERFEVESNVGRKRIQGDRSLFFRTIEDRWATEAHAMRAYSQVQECYRVFSGLATQEVPVVLRSNLQTALLPQLEKDLLACAAGEGAEPKPRHLAPYMSLRFDPPAGWGQQLTDAIDALAHAVHAFREAVGTALCWRAAATSTGAPGNTGNTPLFDSTIGDEVEATAAATSAPGGTGGTPSGTATSSTNTAAVFVKSVDALRRRSNGASLVVSGGCDDTDGGTGDMPTHPVQQQVFEWSCNKLMAQLAQVEALPLCALTSSEDVLMWKTNVMSAAVALNFDTSHSAGQSVVAQLDVNGSMLSVEVPESSADTVQLVAVPSPTQPGSEGGGPSTRHRATIQGSGVIHLKAQPTAPILQNVLLQRQQATLNCVLATRRGTFVAKASPQGERLVALATTTTATEGHTPPPIDLTPQKALGSSDSTEYGDSLAQEASIDAKRIARDGDGRSFLLGQEDPSVSNVDGGSDPACRLQRFDTQSLLLEGEHRRFETSVSVGGSAELEVSLGVPVILQALRGIAVHLAGKRTIKQPRIARRASLAPSPSTAPHTGVLVQIEVQLRVGDASQRGSTTVTATERIL